MRLFFNVTAVNLIATYQVFFFLKKPTVFNMHGEIHFMILLILMNFAALIMGST